MAIVGDIRPLPVSERNKNDALYRELEIKMQQLGYLTPYRETLNWQHTIGAVECGEPAGLQLLKKRAAKNDGVPFFLAKHMKKTIFRQLILHPNDQGFYLPYRFEAPFELEIQGNKIWFGSIIQLAEELKWLEIAMNQEASEEVVAYWEKMRSLCQIALDAESPFEWKVE
ncbi:hypothetical protein ACFO4N_08765 [Camelliibacillus cellulosilyticus]|uniref:Uncharacterized protein n=1 Tax=Camelliibacillus cellulosilyticus TaxID=2174486 RepID=A0ABV9GPH2_9BACL